MCFCGKGKDISLSTTRNPMRGDTTYGKRWRFYYDDGTGVSIAYNHVSENFEVCQFMHRGNNCDHRDVHMDGSTATEVGDFSSVMALVAEYSHTGDTMSAEFKQQYKQSAWVQGIF